MVKRIIKWIIVCGIFLLPNLAFARVYWLGRDIDMALQFGYHTDKNWRMVRSYGHSILVLFLISSTESVQIY